MAVFRVEKTRDFTVMSNHHFRNRELSLKAKGLLSLMLSLPDEWDFTSRGLASLNKDGVDSISGGLKELENHGYLTRRRLRDKNGRMGDIEYTIHESPITEESTENKDFSPEPDFPRQVKPDQVKPELEKPRLEKPTQLSTNKSSTKNKSNTNGTNTYPINPLAPAPTPDAPDVIDGMDEIYRQVVKDNIEYDILLEKYDHERLDETVELIVQTVISNRSTIRVAGDDFPREVVKSRMLKLRREHIEYAFLALDGTTSEIRNIKAYLLTTLFNASVTMDSYFRAKVNYDLYGGGDAY